MELGTVDKILDEFEIKTFEKPKYNPQTKKWEKEQVPYFNDTWIAGYNREQMLETNDACELMEFQAELDKISHRQEEAMLEWEELSEQV